MTHSFKATGKRQLSLMGRTGQTDVGPVARVVIKHARDAFGSQREIDDQWHSLNYTGRPDFVRAVEEYQHLIGLLEELGAQLEFLPPT